MHEQELRTQQHENQQGLAPMPRRAWERPVLQRLHVSLDTAAAPGSGGDLQNGTGASG